MIILQDLVLQRWSESNTFSHFPLAQRESEYQRMEGSWKTQHGTTVTQYRGEPMDGCSLLNSISLTHLKCPSSHGASVVHWCNYREKRGKPGFMANGSGAEAPCLWGLQSPLGASLIYNNLHSDSKLVPVGSSALQRHQNIFRIKYSSCRHGWWQWHLSHRARQKGEGPCFSFILNFFV